MSWQRPEGDSHLCGVELADLDRAQRDALGKCFAFFRKNAEF